MEPGDSEKLFKGLIPDKQVAPIPTKETRDAQTPSDRQPALGDASITKSSTADFSPSGKKDIITEQPNIEPATTILTGSSVKDQPGQSKGGRLH